MSIATPSPRSDEEKALGSHPLPSILSWTNLSYSIKDKLILQSIDGQARSGELLAVMGPSGAGKTSFFSVLTKQVKGDSGEILLDGSPNFIVREEFSFCEQDDALLGTLTVKETVTYAARLSLPRDTSNVSDLVEMTLKSLGLQDVANDRIGTPIQRGISGGQKRRVTIACCMVARPRVLILDEPTSGLDAASAREVVSSLKRLAVSTNTICIASIHQPNWETFACFDHLLLLAGGQMMYNGSAGRLDDYFSTALQKPTPRFINPTDHAVSVCNSEFYTEGDSGVSSQEYIKSLAATWKKHAGDFGRTAPTQAETDLFTPSRRNEGAINKTLVLMDRNVKNYTRNLLAYGIRMGIYVGMGFLLATVWIRLGTSTEKINDRLSVHFFSVAFLGFLSVAGIPSFLEERSVFIRERFNGLYSPGVYMVALTLTSIPFLFLCTLVFVLMVYWSIGLHPGGGHFFKFLIYLFLGVFAAESQALLVSAIIPIFVAALALASFGNGLWMVVQGYFIKTKSLPIFWRDTFHWIDYQTFSFELLVRNDLTGLVFHCPKYNGVCTCPFPSSIADTASNCPLAGKDILDNLGYSGANDGLYVGILIIIVVVMRLAMWGVLVWRKR